MTIDEAITRLHKLALPLKTKNDLENHNSVRLGIEALKAWKEHRGTGSLMSSLLLPGETEE